MTRHTASEPYEAALTAAQAEGLSDEEQGHLHESRAQAAEMLSTSFAESEPLDLDAATELVTDVATEVATEVAMEVATATVAASVTASLASDSAGSIRMFLFVVQLMGEP